MCNGSSRSCKAEATAEGVVSVQQSPHRPHYHSGHQQVPGVIAWPDCRRGRHSGRKTPPSDNFWSPRPRLSWKIRGKSDLYGETLPAFPSLTNSPQVEDNGASMQCTHWPGQRTVEDPITPSQVIDDFSQDSNKWLGYGHLKVNCCGRADRQRTTLSVTG